MSAASNNDNDNDHNIGHLTRNTIALILAGGRGSRLMNMTDWRAKPAVPFGGKFRIIDFTLYNPTSCALIKFNSWLTLPVGILFIKFTTGFISEYALGVRYQTYCIFFRSKKKALSEND